jgi:hypothetical protein
MRINLAVVCIVLIAFPTLAHALTKKELQRYDKDGNGALDSEEMKVYQAHLDDPILAKYDVNVNGRLDPDELKALRADIEKKYGGAKPQPPKPITDPDKKFAAGKDAYDAGHGGIPLDDLAQTPKAIPDECKAPQELFVRKDRLDSFLYGITPVAKAQGASVSFTDDESGHLKTATVNGMVAVLPQGWRQPCIKRPAGYGIDDAYLSAYAIAPWVSLQGTINDPVKATEKNALIGGFDAQWTVFGGGLFNLQAFKVSPYLQTDFRGIAQVGGVAATWEPWQYAIRLGGSPTLLSPSFDWYWRFQAEADERRVDKVGYTSLKLGQYSWVGGTAQFYGFFFPTNTIVPPFLQNRLNTVISWYAYWDAESSKRISKYTASLAYNITENGDASVSLEYDHGTDKDTLAFLNQYLVKLNYKY